MAKRTNNPFHDERTRQKIQTSQLINRLNDFANGSITLESSQVKAIEILLRKTLPDLASVQNNVTIEKSAWEAIEETESANGDSAQA